MSDWDSMVRELLRLRAFSADYFSPLIGQLSPTRKPHGLLLKPFSYSGQGDDDMTGCLYVEEQETPEEYREGGYHPVGVGDVYQDRYCVIR